jgi:hypothetical protein
MSLITFIPLHGFGAFGLLALPGIRHLRHNPGRRFAGIYRGSPSLQAFADLCLVSPIRGRVVNLIDSQVILIDKSIFRIMSILITDCIPKALRTFVMTIA